MSVAHLEQVSAGGDINLTIQQESQTSLFHKFWVYGVLVAVILLALSYTIFSPDITQKVGTQGIGVVNTGSGGVNISLPEKSQLGK